MYCRWITWLVLVGDLPGSMDAPLLLDLLSTEEIHFEKKKKRKEKGLDVVSSFPVVFIVVVLSIYCHWMT